MSDSTNPLASRPAFTSPLDELVREGARRILQHALELEIEEMLATFAEVRDEQGRQRLVRNGHLPERTIITAAGAITIEQPRLRDRAGKDAPDRIYFSSRVLPPYLRRTTTMEKLIPWLYLKGISSNDMGEALAPLIGEGATGVSARVVGRLKEDWSKELEQFNRRDLSQKEYVYLWADGVYFNIRLGDDDRQCILVLMGATRDGKKELVGIQDGHRESEQSWHELLTSLKARGLRVAPAVAVGDGALGFWAALAKAFPQTREQRCWLHKMSNILDKLPKSLHGRAKDDLHEIVLAENKQKALEACALFVEKYQSKYPKATECLEKDRDELLTFFDFPAEHWKHLRTTNPIESTFGTVRLRHRRTKGSGSRDACLAMVFKLIEHAQSHWRRLDGAQHIPAVLVGRTFKDGIIVVDQKDAA